VYKVESVKVKNLILKIYQEIDMPEAEEYVSINDTQL